MEASARSSPGPTGWLSQRHSSSQRCLRPQGAGAPGASWMSTPAVPLGPTDSAAAMAHPGRSPAPDLHAASLPRALVPGEARPPPGEKDPAQRTWDPSGEEALRLQSVIGGVGDLCPCVCVCDRQTHSHTHRGSLLETSSLKGCGRGNTVQLGKKLPRRWASWERRRSPEP